MDKIIQEQRRMMRLAGLIKEEHYIDEPPHDASLELPKNNKTINAKLSSKEGIKNALYKILEVDSVQGLYRDENWAGISKFRKALESVGADVELENSRYEGHGTVSGLELLPTKKVYNFNVSVRDKKGKIVMIPFKVTCAFVGATGTSEDELYELTYYAMH